MYFYSVHNCARLLGFYIRSDKCLEVEPYWMALLSYLVNHGIGYCCGSDALLGTSHLTLANIP